MLYSQLRNLFARLKSQHAMEWVETLDIEYDAADLEGCEILSLWITHTVDGGGNTLGRVYADMNSCPKCGVERHGPQIAPLRLEPSTIHSVDLQVTEHHEILCSRSFRDLIETDHVGGIRFEPVVWQEPDGASGPTVFQLRIDAVLGPLALSTPLIREHACEVCGEYRNIGLDGPPERRLLRFPQSSLHGEALGRTLEMFGAECKFPRLVCSQAFYALLGQGRITGWIAEPALIE
jgi:hypothetical protein